MPSGWKFTKKEVNWFDPSSSLSQTVEAVSQEDFLKSVRNAMLTQAKLLACNSSVTPEEISAGVSISASAGALIVGGQGSISFSAKWMTAKLCSS
jgi:hypothetical protein